VRAIVVAGAWVVAGCGRVGFDSTTVSIDARSCSATNNHDEDGDGIVDDCDPCVREQGRRRGAARRRRSTSTVDEF